MADRIKVSKPMNEAPRMNQAPQAPQYYPERRRGSMVPWLVLVVLVIVLGVLGFLFRDKLFSSGTADKMEKSSGYQAVFLTNGQVYFGKLSGATGEWATLKDIYYLQVVQQPGLQGSANQNAQQQQQQQAQLSLVKLGNELHGPVDSMQIARNQILFYEDMKDDSKVIQAIKEYKANPNGGNTQSQQAPANTVPANTTPTK